MVVTLTSSLCIRRAAASLSGQAAGRPPTRPRGGLVARPARCARRLRATGNLGWSHTTVPAGTAEHYRAELAGIERALVAYRHPESRPERTQKNKNGTVARCGCGRQFRITVSVLAAGPITCGICGEEFLDDSDES